MPEQTNPAPAKTIRVTLPRDLLAMLDQYVPLSERNEFIVEAIKQRLEMVDFQAVLDETAGTWSEANHPELRTPEDIDRWVTELRGSWGAQ
jgi:hypothetical protein